MKRSEKDGALITETQADYSSERVTIWGDILRDLVIAREPFQQESVRNPLRITERIEK